MSPIDPADLLIRRSGIHGCGCYTTVPIPEGTHIVEYTGTRLSKDQADELYNERPDTYLFCIGEGDWVRVEEIARRCLDLGLFISLAGPVTYKNARALPEVARFVPADRLVLETDCPFLPPHPHRGQRNEPAWVAITAAHVATLRGVTLETLGPMVTANARRLFRLSDR